MLDEVERVLLAAPLQLIKFADKDDILLANIPFNNIFTKDTDQYWFRIGASIVLSAAVIASGVVTKFKIDGQDEMTLIPDAITGTVGNIGSGADIKFNNTTWVIGSSVKLNSLYFFIR